MKRVHPGIGNNMVRSHFSLLVNSEFEMRLFTFNTIMKVDFHDKILILLSLVNKISVIICLTFQGGDNHI